MLETALSAITEAVLIDGFTQGDIEEPRIELNGGFMWASGLRVQAGNVRIRGLSIVNFTEHGIVLANPANSVGCQVYASRGTTSSRATGRMAYSWMERG